MIMNNDDKALMKDIVDDLNKKSLEELIYINFNPEHYVNEFTSDGRKANENLLNEVKELNRQYEEKKSQYESIKSNIENCKAQYEQKENELKNLYQQKQNIESNVTVEKLIQELGNYIQQNFYQPKEQLVKDFLNKKIDFETFKNQFKDLSLKFHYYSIIKDKLNLCK